MEKASSDTNFTQTTQVLGLLRKRQNVLLSGPPACGKSFLLGQVASAFRQCDGPDYLPESSIPLPSQGNTPLTWLPSPLKTDRRVYRTTFDQNTKQSDFLRGLVPSVDPDIRGLGLSFRVSKGVFYEASEHAKQDDGASLLIIDEINRGPAVAVFGSSIASIELDKRLNQQNDTTDSTQTFRLLNDYGVEVDYALSPHLYILAAMNQADTSVEPLDVAFLRRFASYPLSPQMDPLLSHFDLELQDLAGEGDLDDSSSDLYIALVCAWQAVNDRINLVRGDHYQIGHGVLMSAQAPDNSIAAAEYVRQAWGQIYQHLREVFFGDDAMIAAVLGADSPGSFYHLNRTSFYGQSIARLEVKPRESISELKTMLQSVATAVNL